MRFGCNKEQYSRVWRPLWMHCKKGYRNTLSMHSIVNILSQIRPPKVRSICLQADRKQTRSGLTEMAHSAPFPSRGLGVILPPTSRMGTSVSKRNAVTIPCLPKRFCAILDYFYDGFHNNNSSLRSYIVDHSDFVTIVNQLDSRWCI